MELAQPRAYLLALRSTALLAIMLHTSEASPTTRQHEFSARAAPIDVAEEKAGLDEVQNRAGHWLHPVARLGHTGQAGRGRTQGSIRLSNFFARLSLAKTVEDIAALLPFSTET